MFSQINFLAVFVAAVAAMVLAFGYYMPPVFGLRWAALTKRYTGLSDAQLGANLPIKMGLWFVGFLVNAVALALLLGMMGNVDLTKGLTLSVIACLGIGAVATSWPPIHAHQPIGIWLLNNGLFLLQQIVMAAILTWWR